MNQITQLTSNANQSFDVTLSDGSLLSLTIYYSDIQQGWFITNLTWNSFTLQGIRICNNPNILRQWENLINFGLACYTSGNREPTQQQDFLSGAAVLYTLNEAEVQQYSEFLSG